MELEPETRAISMPSLYQSDVSSVLFQVIYLYLREVIQGPFIAATLLQAVQRQGSCPRGAHSLVGETGMEPKAKQCGKV